ncbi:MAG TPA: hypothetical protein VLV78_01245 [Thermoanaerobaculia bacterium]|nr:hypothetical protein [Thermoanaerobaculia bacterium]
MKKTSIAIAALSLLLAFGCKNRNQQTASNTEPQSTSVSQSNSISSLTPEQLGELGAKIKNHPADAEKILAAQGLTQQSFEEQVRKVAEDPGASKRYAEAYKKAV